MGGEWILPYGETAGHRDYATPLLRHSTKRRIVQILALATPEGVELEAPAGVTLSAGEGGSLLPKS